MSRAERTWTGSEVSFNEQTLEDGETYFADNFTCVDRRPNAILGRPDKAAIRGLQETLVEACPQIAGWHQPLRMSGDVLLGRLRRWSDPAVAEADWDAIHVIVAGPDGLELMELYDPGQLDEATARYDELLADSAGGSASEHNVAHGLLHRFGKILRSGELERLPEIFETNVVVEDHRSTVSLDRLVGIDAIAEVARATADAGIELSDRSGGRGDEYAARGDNHVLVTNMLYGPDGQELARLLIASVGASGRINYFAMYDVDDFERAETELDRRWLATLDPELTDLYRAVRRALFESIKGDSEVVAEYLTEDFTFHSERSLGFGSVDRETFIELMHARADVHGSGHPVLRSFTFGPGRTYLSEVEISSQTRELGQATEDAVILVGRPDAREIYKLQVLYMFDDTELDAARTRFHDLGDSPPT